MCVQHVEQTDESKHVYPSFFPIDCVSAIIVGFLKFDRNACYVSEEDLDFCVHRSYSLKAKSGNKT